MKKVLIITYHWPPSGGITVLRCLKFVKYLRYFGWEPVVFTAKNPSYQFLDHHNEKDIPDGIEIHKVPIFEPINAFKAFSGRKKEQPLQNITTTSTTEKGPMDKIGMWVRGNFFIPDARYRWIRPSVKYLQDYLEDHKIDAILTDGPPHTNTVIGMRLAQQFGIPWLADFQDPWTQVDYYKKFPIGKRADRIHRELEQEVFRTASKITIASPTWKEDLESIGASDVDVIYYGYDETDFSDYKPRPNGKFTIFHGGLMGSDRNPRALFGVLQRLLEEWPEWRERLEIKLAGEVDHEVVQALKECGLYDQANIMGMIPRKEVMRCYEEASLLLLPINIAENAQGRIPGKLFEMLRCNKPILVLGPENGDVKAIVEDKQKGLSFEYEDREGLYTFLKAAIGEGEFDNFSPEATVEEFSNRMLTQKIARLLDKIVKPL